MDALASRVLAERAERIERQIEPMLHQIASALEESKPALIAKSLALPDLTANEIANLETRLQERALTGEKRRGPTRGGKPKPASAEAALDIWRLHNVIFPRFWEKVRRGSPLSTEQIAAERHGVRAGAALSWYDKHVQ